MVQVSGVPFVPFLFTCSLVLFRDAKLASFGLQSGSLLCASSSDSGYLCLDLVWLLGDLVQRGWVGPETG